MGTFTVTPSPIEVYTGGQTTPITIVNLGPSTVYLEGNSSVTPLNGLKFPAMAQMTWNPSTPLFAVTDQGGSATLTTNVNGSTVDANRSRFWALLGSAVNNTNGVIPNVDTGHCETVLIKITTTSPQNGQVDPTVFHLRLFWYDELGNIMDYDSCEVANLSALTAQQPGIIFVRVPVIGNALGVQWQQTGGVSNYSSIDRVDIYGTDRRIPFSWYCSNPFTLAPILTYNKDASISSQGGDGFSYFGLTVFGSRIYLANLGKLLHTTVQVNTVTNDGWENILKFGDNTNVGVSTTFPVAAGNQTATTELIIPQKQLLYLTHNGGSLAGTSYDVEVSWKEL